jgi:hypothetical protein
MFTTFAIYVAHFWAVLQIRNSMNSGGIDRMIFLSLALCVRLNQRMLLVYFLVRLNYFRSFCDVVFFEKKPSLSAGVRPFV